MVQKKTLSKVVVICGPTASGKTGLSIRIAEKFNGEIISADSVAIYKKLDIGSAKPTKEEMRSVKHYMIDVIEPTESFSVSDYESLAMPIVKDVLSRGKLPIICGGTGFYINSLLYKFSYGNHPADPAVREKYERILREEGEQKLFDLLRSIDEETAKKLHPHDTVRVIRALEIFDCTGIKKSDIADEKEPRFDFIAIMPTFERETLYARINERVDLMIKNGLEQEVRDLLTSGITLQHQCMQGIGYKETAEAISEHKEIPTELIKMNSRRYAKRQITFFKRTDNLLCFDASDNDKLLNDCFESVSGFILN